jgi:hypothetical protein
MQESSRRPMRLGDSFAMINSRENEQVLVETLLADNEPKAQFRLRVLLERQSGWKRCDSSKDSALPACRVLFGMVPHSQ